jgi:hypothetical protein
MTGRVDERSGEQLSSNYGGMDFFIRVYAPVSREVRATGGMIKDLLDIIRHNVKLLQNIM